MDYILLIVAVLCIGIGFIFNKVYQLKLVDSNRDLWIYQLLSAGESMLIFLAFNKFDVSFGGYGVFMACLYGFLCLAYSVIGIFAIKIGKLSVYTMFLMIGGMLLPYIYGVIYLDEELTVCRIVGMFVLISSLIFNSFVSSERSASKPKPLFWMLCVIVFTLNGFVSITSKAHQINAKAIGTNDFMIWTNLFKLVSSAVVLAVYIWFLEPKTEKQNIKKTASKKLELYLLLTVAFATTGGISSYLMLETAKTLDAVVLYPFVTGGTTIITAVMARLFFKEKITKLSALSLLLMLGGTILFMF